jgi:sugar phosphate isomerase/epimerase
MIARPPLSVSLAGLAPLPDAPWAGSPRAPIEWAAAAGLRSVRLDAGALRARDLDRSARRDLASLLRRLGLACPGLDLWIPAPHFADPARADRAAEALTGASELAGDLRTLAAGQRISIAVTFPQAGADALIRQVAGKAESFGCVIADHSFPGSPSALSLAAQPGSSIGIGLDPAAILMSGGDPAAEASRAGHALAAARLSDASAIGRTTPGEGRLDELAYLVALAAAGYAGEVALDLRGLPDQKRAAATVLDRWASPLA